MRQNTGEKPLKMKTDHKGKNRNEARAAEVWGSGTDQCDLLCRDCRLKFKNHLEGQELKSSKSLS